MSREYQTENATATVTLLRPLGGASVVLVCEHASSFIPEEFHDLGLSPVARQSHVAWDPGAMGVACGLSERLDARLVAASVSRLVYDCNRPPDARDAMPATSEVFDIPGNVGLSDAERADRVARFYQPFRAALDEAIKAVVSPIIVTIHSFTPVYHGQPRAVEIGVLHDSDARLADEMLQIAQAHTSAKVMRNQPYGPQHGVTHTLREHAIAPGYLNVMLEIRNDLIATEAQQNTCAEMLAGWITSALANLRLDGGVQCQA